jgi:hypothetical protein
MHADIGHLLAALRVLASTYYRKTYSEYAKFRSAPPLFLEDEDIFQKILFFARRDSESDRWVPVNYLYWIFLYLKFI